MPTGTIVAAGLMVAASAGIATAAPLATGSLTVGPGDALRCSILNISNKKPLKVILNMVLGSTTTGPVEDTILPAEDSGLTLTNDASGPRVGYCIFDIKGGKKNARVVACLQDVSNGRNCIAALPGL